MYRARPPVLDRKTLILTTGWTKYRNRRKKATVHTMNVMSGEGAKVKKKAEQMLRLVRF